MSLAIVQIKDPLKKHHLI